MVSKSTGSSSETRVGVDVGGTNTDVILVTEDDEFTFKTPSTTDPSQSTLTGIVEVCQLAGIEPADVDQILHGTTVATNALIEHEGAKTGLLTTDGFRDVLHIGRHRKPHSFSLQQTISWQEQPIVKRRHRKEITERVYPPGDVVIPLDEDAVLKETGDLVHQSRRQHSVKTRRDPTVQSGAIRRRYRVEVEPHVRWTLRTLVEFRRALPRQGHDLQRPLDPMTVPGMNPGGGYWIRLCQPLVERRPAVAIGLRL